MIEKIQVLKFFILVFLIIIFSCGTLSDLEMVNAKIDSDSVEEAEEFIDVAEINNAEMPLEEEQGEQPQQTIVEPDNPEQEVIKVLYTNRESNCRFSPCIQNNIKCTIPINSSIDVLEEIEGWYKIKYNNEECYIKQELLSEQKVVELPQVKKDKDKKEQTAIAVVKEPSKISLGKYKITAYCGCLKCCGKTNCITASGLKAVAGRTIAAPANFSFGTKIEINNHTYIVEDRGGAIKGNRIDMYFNSHSEALRWGVKYYDIYKVS